MILLSKPNSSLSMWTDLITSTRGYSNHQDRIHFLTTGEQNLFTHWLRSTGKRLMINVIMQRFSNLDTWLFGIQEAKQRTPIPVSWWHTHILPRLSGAQPSPPAGLALFCTKSPLSPACRQRGQKRGKDSSQLKAVIQCCSIKHEA